MVRRTVNLPDSTDALVRDLAAEDESFSAAVSRRIEAGARPLGAGRPPPYVASGEGPDDLGRAAERYLGELASSD